MKSSWRFFGCLLFVCLCSTRFVAGDDIFAPTREPVLISRVITESDLARIIHGVV